MRDTLCDACYVMLELRASFTFQASHSSSPVAHRPLLVNEIGCQRFAWAASGGHILQIDIKFDQRHGHFGRDAAECDGATKQAQRLRSVQQAMCHDGVD